MPGSVAGSAAGSSNHHSTSGIEILRPGEENDLLEERAFSTGAMGIMYTVCKEKVTYSNVFIAFRLLADWLQLWLLVVQPPQFSLPPDKLWWQVISFISLNQFMSARGYQFFLACFYLLVFGLILSVGLSVWVGYSFQQNRFEHVWPIIVLRWFAKIFYQILDIMSLSLFLMVLDCQTFSRPDNVVGYNQEFPDVYCWSMPHIIHVVVAVVSLLVFVFLAGAFTVGEMELDFTTRNQIAIMHTEKELWAFGLRALMTFVNVFIYSPKWASVAQLGLSCWLTYLIWYWQPQIEGWVNHVRTGMYASVVWCSLLYVISAFNLGWDASDDAASTAAIKKLTGLMWGLTIPMGCLGALTSWLRLRYFQLRVLPLFKGPIPEDTKDLYEFTDSRFVEVLARCCRVWVKKSVLDPQAVALGEAVIKVGITQMPKDPFMMILHSSFLMDVLSSYQSGYTQLQAAKKLETSFLMRFAIFSREQQHAQRSAAGGLGNRAADLVSYVEFQRNYGLLLKVHRDTLTNIQRFWHCLMHKSVKFKTLADSVQSMDASIRQADRVYKQVLSRHATSVKIVQLYAKFLEHVKQDPWAASRWFAEAERLATLEEEMKHNDALEGLDDPTLKSALLQAGRTETSSASAEQRAVIIINAQSNIVITNNAVFPILGYTKTELKGKALRVILPPTVAENHVGYVRNYIATGRGVVINNTTEQVAMHKDKHLVPIKLTVRKVSGIGEDTQFMGILEPISMPPDEASLWLRPDGTIILACCTFEDWFGYSAKEVQGVTLTGLAVSGAKQLEQAMKKAFDLMAAQQKQHMIKSMADTISRKGTQGESILLSGRIEPAPSQAQLLTDFPLSDTSEEEQTVSVSGISFAHKFGSPCSVNIQIKNAGVGSSRYHVLTITRSRRAVEDSVGQLQDMQSPTELLLSPKSPNALRSSSTIITEANQELMLVTNSKGQVCHISTELAELLGRTRQQAMANNAMHIVESLMIRPFGNLHRPLLQGGTSVVMPAFSCRSGLSVLMQGTATQGQVVARPVTLSISKKVVGDNDYHVAIMQERTMQQALDERRLLFRLDEQATVIQVLSQSPSSLFGCDPEKLVGKHAGSFLDVLRSPGAAQGAEMDTVDTQHAMDVFLEMAGQALHATSCAWRVGFVQPELYQGSELLATAKARGMLSNKAKPAIMRMKAVVAGDSDFDDNQQITFEVELWRADLCASILELDGHGNVVVPELPELSQLYPSDLILGMAPEHMVDQHVSGLLPALAHKNLQELFNAGAFGLPAAAARGVGHVKRSAMKSYQGASVAGPVHTLTMKHHLDQADMQVTVQSVHKTGSSQGMFLVIHAVRPTGGRPDFGTWIATAHRPSSRTSNNPRVRRLSLLKFGSLKKQLTPLRDVHPPGVVTPAVLPEVEEVPELPEPPVLVPVSVPAPVPERAPSAALRFSIDERPSSTGSDSKESQDSPPSSSRPKIRGSPRMGLKKTDSLVSNDVDKVKEARVASFVNSQPGINAIKTAWEHDEGTEPEDDNRSITPPSSDHGDMAIDIADDADAQANAMDEADYKRGQRFKRLYAMLSSPAVLAPVSIYRRHAYTVAAMVVAFQVAAFVAMLVMLRELRTMATTLTDIGEAGSLAAEVAVFARSTHLVFAGITAPQLRVISGPKDLPYLMYYFNRSIQRFKARHQKIYVGSGKPKKMPVDFNLRAIWDENTFPIVDTFNVPASQANNNFTTIYQVQKQSYIGLWEAGSIMTARAEMLLKNQFAYNASLNGNMALWANETNLLWIVNNVVTAVFPGYLQTIDSYLQLVVQKSTYINTAQLILLLVEGLFLSGVLSIWTWWTLADVARLRFNIYNIFMTVPTSLVRRLATKKYVLGDEEEEEDEQDTIDVKSKLSQGASQHGKMQIHVKTANNAEHAAPESFWAKVAFNFKSMFGLQPEAQQSEGGRVLLPCKRTILWMLWPFLLWGIMVIIGNTIGYILLGQIPGPVALYNAVNYVKMLYNRNNFFIQEMMCERDLTRRNMQRDLAFARCEDLRKEYSLMLRGNSATPNETTPHYTLVHEGVIHSSQEAAYILFGTTDCLCLEPQIECLPPTNKFYPLLHQGLDRMVQAYISVTSSIPVFTNGDPYVNGPEYDYLWNSQPDMRGGFTKITDVFQAFVVTNLQSVVVLHIVLFVLTLVVMIGFLIFMLRPFLKAIDNETRRIAELLSQLPAEVDVTTLVMKTLMPPEPDGTGLEGLPSDSIASIRMSGCLQNKRGAIVGEVAGGGVGGGAVAGYAGSALLDEVG